MFNRHTVQQDRAITRFCIPICVANVTREEVVSGTQFDNGDSQVTKLLHDWMDPQKISYFD
ncbi:hypothetical protein LINGRAHAP2_LOCUS31506, partial [Linum grandiflorum]